MGGAGQQQGQGAKHCLGFVASNYENK